MRRGIRLSAVGSGYYIGLGNIGGTPASPPRRWASSIVDSIAARRAAPAPRVPSGQVIDAETADPMQGETPEPGNGREGRTDPALSRTAGARRFKSPHLDEMRSYPRGCSRNPADLEVRGVKRLGRRSRCRRSGAPRPGRSEGERRRPIRALGSVEPDTRPESFRRALADISPIPTPPTCRVAD